MTVSFAAEMDVLRILGWTLLHSVWQGALIGATAWVVLRALRGASPFARHACAATALALLLLVPVATAFRLATRALPDAPALVTSSATGPDRGTAPMPQAMPGPGAESGESPARIASGSSAGLGGRAPGAWQEAVESKLPGVVILWLAGLVWFGWRLNRDMLHALRLRREPGGRPAAHIEDAVRRVAGALGLTRPVRIAVSARIDGPAVVGLLRPVLLIPMHLASGLTPVQLNVLLAHELAHIQRRDHLLNAIQLTGEVLLFFNPVVWWISRVIREEREQCCDAVAARRMGEPMELARALLVLAEHRRATPPRLAMAAGSGALLTRIERLVAPAPQRTVAGGTGVSALALVTVAFWGATAPPAIRLPVTTPQEVRPVEPLVLRHAAAVPAATAAGPEILWSGAIPPGAWLRIRNLTGAVRVEGTNGGMTRVSAERRTGDAAGELSYRILRDSTRGDVVVCVVRPAHGDCDVNGSIWRSRDGERLRASVNIVVTVPRGVNVEAATFDGSLRVTGTTADVEARTGRGNIGASLASGDDRSIELRTGDGDIELELPGGMGGELSARLSSGKVVTEGLTEIPSALSSQRYRARFGAGNSRIEAASGKGDFTVRRSTGNPHPGM